jgi:hypothetical protein
VGELKKMCEQIVAEPGASVTCTGNTDTVGSEQYNQKLGMARATAVRDFMVKQGVDAKTIKIDSKGEMEPAAGEPPAQHDPDPGQKDPKNRRVEVVATWPSGGGKGGGGAKAPGKSSGPAKAASGAKPKPKGSAKQAVKKSKPKTAAKPKPKPKAKGGAKGKR